MNQNNKYQPEEQPVQNRKRMQRILFVVLLLFAPIPILMPFGYTVSPAYFLVGIACMLVVINFQLITIVLFVVSTGVLIALWYLSKFLSKQLYRITAPAKRISITVLSVLILLFSRH